MTTLMNICVFCEKPYLVQQDCRIFIDTTKKSIPYPWKIIKGDFVQIIHANGNHWVCVSRDKESVKLYDSLHKKTTKGEINLIARNVRSK